MDLDQEKLERVVLALLHLNSFEHHGATRAWKSQPWGILDSLHEKGFISNPASKTKSIMFTEEGEKLSRQLCEGYFAIRPDGTTDLAL
jgi:hypothetical protein